MPESALAIGFVGLGVLVALLLLRVPIAAALGLVAVVGTTYVQTTTWEPAAVTAAIGMACTALERGLVDLMSRELAQVRLRVKDE